MLMAYIFFGEVDSDQIFKLFKYFAVYKYFL